LVKALKIEYNGILLLNSFRKGFKMSTDVELMVGRNKGILT